MAFIERITRWSYTELALLWISVILCFALAYFTLAQWLPSHAPSPIGEETLLHRIGDSLYFSIVTATTVGYGDITPQGISKVLVCIQSVLAFFVFGVCVSKLVTNKQEIAIEQMYKLTFEDVFRNTREGLYIVRKDIDHVRMQAEASGTVDAEHWENLAIAYKQAESILSEIPQFYTGTDSFYTIDERREQLLQEAVHRTLRRINHLLDRLSTLAVDWTRDTPSMEELRNLVTLAKTVTEQWKQRSPYGRHEAFEDIFQEGTKIHGKITRIA